MKILATFLALGLVFWVFAKALTQIVMGLVHVLIVTMLAAAAIGLIAVVAALLSAWVERRRKGSAPLPAGAVLPPTHIRPALATLQDTGQAGSAVRAMPLAAPTSRPQRGNRSEDSAPANGATGSAGTGGTSTPQAGTGGTSTPQAASASGAPGAWACTDRTSPHDGVPVRPRHSADLRHVHAGPADEIAVTDSMPVRPRAVRHIHPPREASVWDGGREPRRSPPAPANGWLAAAEAVAALLDGRPVAYGIRRVFLIDRCSGIQYGKDNDQYSVYRAALPSAVLKSNRDLARHMLSDSRGWSDDAFTHDAHANLADQAGGGATFHGLTETAAGDTLVIVRNSRGVQVGDGNTQHNEFRISVTNVTVTAERFSLSQAAVTRLCQNPSRAAAEALADRVAEAARGHLVVDLTAQVNRAVGDPAIPGDAAGIHGRTGAQGGTHNRAHVKIAVDVVRVDGDNLAADLLAEARRSAAETQRAVASERAADARRVAQIRAAKEQRAAERRSAAEILRAADARDDRDIGPVRGPDIGPAAGPAVGGFGF